MKIRRYLVHLADTYILGPCVSHELGQLRVGLSLVIFEIGIAFDSGKEYGYACSGCGATGSAIIDCLPEGWEKRYRRDHTYFFVCGKCHGYVEPNEDYIVTDENRAVAIDEILGQLTDKEDSDAHVKALRDYANKLLDESEPFSKWDLSASVCSYDDGFTDAMEAKKGKTPRDTSE